MALYLREKGGCFFLGWGCWSQSENSGAGPYLVKVERRSIVSQDEFLSEISIISLRVAKVWVTLTHMAACVATFRQGCGFRQADS